MPQYLVIYEQGQDSWGAYSPDLPGCTAVGSSRGEVEQLMQEAVEAHVDVLRSQGLAVPPPSSFHGCVAAKLDDKPAGRTGSRRKLGAAAIDRSGRSDVSERVEAIIRAEIAPFALSPAGPAAGRRPRRSI